MPESSRPSLAPYPTPPSRPGGGFGVTQAEPGPWRPTSWGSWRRWSGAHPLAEERRGAPGAGGGRGPAGGAAARRGHAAAMWFSYLTVLARGRQAPAMDLPGFGLSSPPEGALPRAEDGRRALHRAGGGTAADAGAGAGGGGGALAGGAGGAGAGAVRGKVPVERLVLIDSMGLGPQMTPLARTFFRSGTGAGGADTGAPTLRPADAPAGDTAGPQVGGAGRPAAAVPGGRPRAAKAFNTLGAAHG